MNVGGLISGARQKPDGTLLSWQLTDPSIELEQGLLPFLIDWGESEHPARSIIQGGMLKELQVSHPNPQDLKSKLALLGFDLMVRQGPPGLKAIIATNSGLVALE